MVQASAPIATKDLAPMAIDLIARAGCEYGDVRLCSYRACCRGVDVLNFY